MASNTKQRKAVKAWKKAKIERNKSDLVTLASRRRDERRSLVRTEETKD